MIRTLSILVLSVATQATAVAQTSHVPKEKNPSTALVLGATIPGLGHLYAEEQAKGAGFLAMATGGLVLGKLIYGLDNCWMGFGLSTEPCDPDPRPYRVFGALLILAGATAWIGSAVDAPRAAKRTNDRLRMTSMLRLSQSNAIIGVIVRTP